MNRFDYFQLELPTSEVLITNTDAFSRLISKDGVETSLRYKQKIPYSLSIEVDLQRNKTYISFTGKILLDEYPSLINANNIHNCFERINQTGICRINPLTAINSAVVVECDVTKDIAYDGNLKYLLDSAILKSDYTITKKSRNRFYISNTYVTARKRLTMVVYDKNQELRSSSNAPFLRSLSKKEEVLDYYYDKLRLEINLRSIDRIRYYFCRQDTSLINLLSSSYDPIAIFLDHSMCSDPMLDALITKTPRLRDLEHLLLLCTCGFNLKEVERVVRSTTAKASSITNNMKPYRTLYERILIKRIDPLSDVDMSALQIQIRSALSKAFDPVTPEANRTLPVLYANANKTETPYDFNITFIFNIPYVILPVLPD